MSLQSCPTVRPHRRQPTRLHRPWDSLGKNTGVGCHFLLHCMKVKSEREVAQSCLTLHDPMDCSLQAPLSMGFTGKSTGVGCHRLLRWSLLPLLSSSVTGWKQPWAICAAGRTQTELITPRWQLAMSGGIWGSRLGPAVTKHHKLGGINKRNGLPCSPGV